MRPANDIEAALSAHGPAVWRMCVLHFGNSADAQDAYQNAFLKYALADSATFENEDHRKAWLLRVASNVCKDELRAHERRNLSFDQAMNTATSMGHSACDGALAAQNALMNAGTPQAQGAPSAIASHDSLDQPESFRNDVVDAIRRMDDPPRTPLYLALVEEYPVTEIASMMSAPVNTVYSWVSRGKKLLRKALR